MDIVAWGIALLFLGYAFFLWRPKLMNLRSGMVDTHSNQAIISTKLQISNDEETRETLSLEEYHKFRGSLHISRKILLSTIIPTESRREVRDYTVVMGDSVFGIAQKFNLKPESVLWANYEQLKDNPHALVVGMKLKIPPTDGVLYKWKEGDTVEEVARTFDVNPNDILSWSGNHVDLTNPQFIADSLVMIPGGHREIQQWIIPTIPRGRAGVSAGLYGSGVCPGGYEGVYGSGAFIWPTENHTISGNDYWSGHLAIDIGAPTGASIVAADSGVIVFAGWANGGYGNTVMIDHGNGYQTLYAHLSSVVARCGQSVIKGQIIARSGSTGNSTGPHLHFEIRYQGGFVNPWYVLPSP